MDGKGTGSGYLIRTMIWINAVVQQQLQAFHVARIVCARSMANDPVHEGQVLNVADLGISLVDFDVLDQILGALILA